MIHIRVNGVPAPQGSKRHVGNGRMVEDSRAVGPWREAVRAETQRVLAAARVGTPAGGFYTLRPVSSVMLASAVEVSIVFTFARPKSHYGTGRNAGQVKPSAPSRPVSRRHGDADKLARAVFDGLVAGGALADDSLVTDFDVCKRYPSNGEAPGADIWIREATE